MRSKAIAMQAVRRTWTGASIRVPSRRGSGRGLNRAIHKGRTMFVSRRAESGLHPRADVVAQPRNVQV